jgi:hypothetical protein
MLSVNRSTFSADIAPQYLAIRCAFHAKKHFCFARGPAADLICVCLGARLAN